MLRILPARCCSGSGVNPCSATIAVTITSHSSSATCCSVCVTPLRGFWPCRPMYACTTSPASSVSFITRIARSCGPVPLAWSSQATSWRIVCQSAVLMLLLFLEDGGLGAAT